MDRAVQASVAGERGLRVAACFAEQALDLGPYTLQGIGRQSRDVCQLSEERCVRPLAFGPVPLQGRGHVVRFGYAQHERRVGGQQLPELPARTHPIPSTTEGGYRPGLREVDAHGPGAPGTLLIWGGPGLVEGQALGAMAAWTAASSNWLGDL